MTLIMAGVVVQFFLAGAGAFGATDFDVHRVIGDALVAVAAVAFSFAAAARRHRVATLVVLVLLALQILLAVVATDSERWVGALHGLNALAVGAVAGSLTGRLWYEARAGHSDVAESSAPAGQDRGHGRARAG
jgi:heme A synthase